MTTPMIDEVDTSNMTHLHTDPESFQYWVLVKVRIDGNQYLASATRYRHYSTSHTMELVRAGEEFGPCDILKPVVKAAVLDVIRSTHDIVFIMDLKNA